MSRGDALVRRRPAGADARAARHGGLDRQQLLAPGAGLLGADLGHLGRGEPHLRAARHPRRRQGAARRVPHRRRRHQPLPRHRGRDRLGPVGHRAAHRAGRAHHRQRLRPQAPGQAPAAAHAERGGRAAGALQGGARTVRRRRSSNTSPPAASGRSASSAAPSPTGNWRATSRSSDAPHPADHQPRSTGACTSSVPLASPADIDAALQRARAAQPAWRAVPLAERAAILERFCQEFERRATRHRRRSSPGRWGARSASPRARCAARSSAPAT